MPMLPLEFIQYLNVLKDERIMRNPTQYIVETDTMILLMFKNKEGWKHYTEVKKEDIINHAEGFELNGDDPIDAFKMNYCSDCIPVLPDAFYFEYPAPTALFKETVPDFSYTSVNNGHSHIYNKGTHITGPGGDDNHVHPVDERTGEVGKGDTDHSHKLEFKEKSNKNLVIDEGDDIVDESKTYEEFLNKLFDRFEQKVLSALDTSDLKKIMVNKNFGEFLTDLFNSVNTVAFAKHVRKFIKNDLVSGMTSAESELNVDIGFTEAYEKALNVLHQQQINGYTINGKKWHGIRGTTKEIQAKVIHAVQDGLNTDKSLTDIKDDVKEVFDSFSDWRSQTIARTETNRIINEGKLIGYKETGLEGGKIPKVAIDNRTSPICLRMNDKYGNNPIGLDEDFIDPGTSKAFRAPPFHPNCRTTLAFRTK